MQKQQNNICSVDLGSWTSKLSALTSGHHFEILVNEANFRQTPSVVGFTNAERLIGDQAVTKMKSNYKNTLRAPQRLIGLATRSYVLEEETKQITVPYKVNENSLVFDIESGGERIQLQPEQILAALFTKFSEIYTNNNIKSDILFLSTKSYLNNGQRKALKSCAQAAGFVSVNLVQQWQAIAAEYVFLRQQQIQSNNDQNMVIFIDFGHTNFTIHAISISKNKIKLIDQECLRYTGAKNMDNLLIQFYINIVKQQSGEDIRNNLKALVKVQEAVEQQRKKLSANQQNQLVIECLVGDYDLVYNLKREQFENIVMPILAEMASAMQNLRSRVEPLCPISSVQLLGGASRIPFAQEVVRSVYNMQPSRKMNASESIGRGCSIAAASRLGLIKSGMCNFLRYIRSPVLMFIHSLPKGQTHPLYLEDQSKYVDSDIKILFDNNSLLPGNAMVKIQGQGINQILLCKQDSLHTSALAYFRFKGADNLTIFIDGDGILRARLPGNNNFQVYNVGDLLTVQRLQKIKQKEAAMKKRDYDILHSYQIKNTFESTLYNVKENLSGKWKQFVDEEEASVIGIVISENQEWLASNTNQTTQNFKQRMQTITELISEIKNKKQNYQKIHELRKVFDDSFHTISKLHPQIQVQIKLSQIHSEFVKLYNQQSQVRWSGTFLNQKTMQNTIKQLQKLK